MPTFLLTGNPTLALNLTFLGCIALTACALHLVVRIWTGSHLGGFVAAWTFLMTRWTLWEFVPSAPQYAVLQYIPLMTGFLERMVLATRLPDPEALRALHRETGVEMILVHVYDLEALQAPVWLTLAEHEGSGLRLVARDGGDLLFQIVDAATTGGRAP